MIVEPPDPVFNLEHALKTSTKRSALSSAGMYDDKGRQAIELSAEIRSGTLNKRRLSVVDVGGYIVYRLIILLVLAANIQLFAFYLSCYIISRLNAIFTSNFSAVKAAVTMTMHTEEWASHMRMFCLCSLFIASECCSNVALVAKCLHLTMYYYLLQRDRSLA